MNKAQKVGFLFLVVLLAQRITSVRSECVTGTFYKHQTDCKRFYHCFHGELIEMICYPGLLFNTLINSCDYPENVTCDFGSETTPSTTQDSTSETTQEFTSTVSYETTTSRLTQQPITSASTTGDSTLTTTQEPITTIGQPVPVCGTFITQNCATTIKIIVNNTLDIQMFAHHSISKWNGRTVVQ